MKTALPETLFPNFYTVPGKPDLQAPFVNGNMHYYEEDWLCRIAQCVNAINAFEIGTYNGVSALHLGYSVSGIVWTLDLPDGAITKLEISEWDKLWIKLRWETRDFIRFPENIVQLWGDSATFDFSDYAGECDLVLVMGAHTDAYTRNDLKVAQRLVSEKGVIVWHFGNDPLMPSGIDKDFDMTRLDDSRLVVVK